MSNGVTIKKSAKGPRIAFVSQGSPYSRRSWSGIPYFTLGAITRRFPDTHVIDTPRFDEFLRRASALSRFGMLPSRHRLVTDRFRRIINQQLEGLQPDMVISVGAAHKVVDIDPRWPVIHVADAMFATIVGLYPKYRTLSARTQAVGSALQQRLIDRCERIVLSSDWAVAMAVEAYDVPANRLVVAPMGANLDNDPGLAQIRTATGTLKLLFVGYDWNRKGGRLCLATVAALRARGIDAELHIVGCRPDEAGGLPGVTVHGLLSRADPVEAAIFEGLFRTSSFFLMPSHQEAYGLVYCEACAYGLPPVARATGGVGTIVNDGDNGLLLPREVGSDGYADAIVDVWNDPARYDAMQHAARTAFVERLNWDSWGEMIARQVHRSLAR